MAVVSSVPWIFAAPTGAHRVTVYWDEVPGATGYRVRWGMATGSYPNSSAVLPASARQYTVLGLLSEQEYSFVVEAQYNGLWGPSSEEDSAVPHVGAIPWDSGDASVILQYVRNIVGSVPYGELFVLGPDQKYYFEDTKSGPRSSQPPGYYDAKSGLLHYADGAVVPITTSKMTDIRNKVGDPFRTVRTGLDVDAKVASGTFYLPPPVFFDQSYIYVDASHVNGGKWDAPCINFTIKSRNVIREGGITFHPAGRRGVGYNRWMPFLVPDVQDNREKNPIIGSFCHRSNHIRYEGTFGVGLLVRITCVELLSGKTKALALFVLAYDAAGPIIWRNIFVGYSRRITGQTLVRRVISIAQTLSMEEKKLGYVNTGSFVRNIGVGCLDQNLLIDPVRIWLNNQWAEWRQQSAYEIISIEL